MNLYKKCFSLHDTQGVSNYFTAKNSKECYEIVYTNEYGFNAPTYVEAVEAKYYEDKDGNRITDADKIRELATNEVIQANGEYNVEGLDFNDLYEGKTFYYWELVYENINEEEIKSLKKLGIL